MKRFKEITIVAAALVMGAAVFFLPYSLPHRNNCPPLLREIMDVAAAPKTFLTNLKEVFNDSDEITGSDKE